MTQPGCPACAAGSCELHVARYVEPYPVDLSAAEGERRQAAEMVNHPQHYGGDTVYEAIKVIEAWGLGFHLGNTVKYIRRIGFKGDPLEDARKARWYLDRFITMLEKERT